MLISFKYRLYPTLAQRKAIDCSIDVCRLVYNLALEIKIRAYKEHQKVLSGIDLCYQLVDLKNAYPWIKVVDSLALQASVKKVDISFKNFFAGKGFPKFKSKKGKNSFQCPGNKREIYFEEGLLSIPKIYNIPIRISRRFIGEIKTITISKTNTDKYFAAILVDTGIAVPIKQAINPETTIGIDVGINTFVTTSNGRKFAPNRKLKQNLKRLKILQRRASRKVKGSNNCKKANKSVAILYEKIKNSRLDYIHKVTTQLIRDNQTKSIAIEDLNISGLLANHHIAQAVSDVSFSKFFEILKYKCEWQGINLIPINRFDPSSKRCNNCGTINQKLALNQRSWICKNCNDTHDRDLNAAKNIKWYGITQTILNRSGQLQSACGVIAHKLDIEAGNKLVNGNSSINK